MLGNYLVIENGLIYTDFTSEYEKDKEKLLYMSVMTSGERNNRKTILASE
jgi:hypothetical protein